MKRLKRDTISQTGRPLVSLSPVNHFTICGLSRPGQNRSSCKSVSAHNEHTHTINQQTQQHHTYASSVKQGLFQLCKSSLESWKWKRNATATRVHDNLRSAAYSPLLDHCRCQMSFLGLSPCCPRRPETPTALWSPWQQHHSSVLTSHVRSTGTVCMVLITAYHNPSQLWTMLSL